jgi:hypothetical protein
MGACTDGAHKGHRLFVGGPLDGHVDHMVCSTPSDFPSGFTYPSLGHAMYMRSLDNAGTEVVYEYAGIDARLCETNSAALTDENDT